MTGITVNEKPNVTRRYVRNIRAILHQWEKYGINAVWERYFINPFTNHIPGPESFMQALNGKIEFLGMVIGRKNMIYQRLMQKYNILKQCNNT